MLDGKVKLKRDDEVEGADEIGEVWGCYREGPALADDAPEVPFRVESRTGCQDFMFLPVQVALVT